VGLGIGPGDEVVVPANSFISSILPIIYLSAKPILVDINPDTRWAPNNFKKYGYGTCGEIFSNGKLKSEYTDVNDDGVVDIILSGTQEIICESDDTHEIDTNYKPAGIPIKKVFLWNKEDHAWVEKI